MGIFTRSLRLGQVPRGYATILNLGPTGASGALAASGISGVLGWSITEASGVAVASLVLWDNPSAPSGTHYGQLNLAANESVRDWFGDLGLACLSGGLYVQILAGQVRLAVAVL